jgi:hypothetical protein
MSRLPFLGSLLSHIAVIHHFIVHVLFFVLLDLLD